MCGPLSVDVTFGNVTLTWEDRHIGGIGSDNGEVDDQQYSGCLGHEVSGTIFLE